MSPADSCITGKVCYPTRGAARTASRSWSKRKPSKTKGAKPYRCENCGMWHLGNSTPRPRL